MPARKMQLDDTTEEQVRTVEVGRPRDEEEPTRTHYAAGYVVADKYRLERPIARGGMGQVWLAQNLALDVHVAVKLIRAEVASRRASDRLLTEARAVARLGHRAIVRVFDYGTTLEGDPYLVMELIEGERFDALLIKRKRLPAAHAVQMLLPVASALAAAHGKGIVHRDVKPDNIVLTHDDSGFIVPKLLDFGIAKLREEGRSTLITDEGVTIGSPSYMAPEQAMGEADVDVRADVWGLCTVLYQATTGQRPFSGATYRAVMDAILRAEPVPMPVLGGGDEALWVIVSRGLAKSKTDRWESMRDLGRALATWLIDQGIESDATGTSLKLQWHGDERPSGPSEVLAPLSEPQAVDLWVPFETTPETTPSKAGRWVGPAVGVAAVLMLAAVGIAFAIAEDPARKMAEPPGGVEVVDDASASPEARVAEASADPAASEARDTSSDSAPSEAPSKPVPEPAEKTPEKTPEKTAEKTPEKTPEKTAEKTPEKTPEKTASHVEPPEPAPKAVSRPRPRPVVPPPPAEPEGAMPIPAQPDF